VKYKKWVDEVNRVRGGLETRLDKVRLDKNERLAPFNIEFWNKLMSKITQEHILAYPEVEPLYLKLANFLGVTTENLLITAGSDFAIKVVFELFVNSGDEVIFIDPTFAMVDVYCGLYNVKKIKICYDSNLNLDINKLIEFINEKVSLIIIANPNSPTGTYIDNDALIKILEKAKNFSMPVLVDEAYHGFCPYTAMDLLKSHNNLIITRTFSKTAGLAGLRIGYIVTAPNLAGLLYKFRPMYEVNSIAVLFASELLDNWEIVDDYINAADKGKKYLIKELNDIGFKTIDTYTNFIHVDFGENRDKILKGFEKDGVLIKGKLDVKGFEGYTRISVGNIDEMKKVVKSIRMSIML